MDVVAISVMPLRILQSIANPTISNPGQNFAAVFAEHCSTPRVV